MPLLSHATYRRDELLTALGWASLDRAPSTHREGVAWCPSAGVDALLVTLHKAERDFSPSTRYRDYPLST